MTYYFNAFEACVDKLCSFTVYPKYASWELFMVSTNEIDHYLQRLCTTEYLQW